MLTPGGDVIACFNVNIDHLGTLKGPFVVNASTGGRHRCEDVASIAVLRRPKRMAGGGIRSDDDDPIG